MKKTTKRELSILLGLTLTIIFAVFIDANTAAQKVRDNTLRLHIIANSDTNVDQKTKLLVRDEMLKLSDLIYFDAPNFETSRKSAQENLDEVSQRINKILQENGAQYTSKCTIEPFYFKTGEYTNFVLPQGEYEALTIRLGKAEGKNWWCVMYPALCSEAFSEEATAKAEDFILTDKITVRFKVVEIYEDIKNKITENTAKDYVN